MNKKELLENLRKGREAWNDAMTQVSPSRMEEPGIMGAWTAKDLIAHVTWMEADTVGIVRAKALVGSEWWGLPQDDINQRIYEKYRNDSLLSLEVWSIESNADLIAAVEKLDEADLALELIPGIPLWEQISENSYRHYPQHIPDIQAFINLRELTVTTEEIISRMEYGWSRLHAYLKTLTEDQITRPTDAGGWTVKDHLMHLAVWEDGVEALFNHQNRYERMGLDKAAWESEGFDLKNDIIQKQHRTKSLMEVLEAFEKIHQRLIATIRSLTDADLMRPYKFYAADSTNELPVFGSVVGNTYGHYAEHLPWIAGIIAVDKLAIKG